MFFISMPKAFQVGDTLGCVINGDAARVTWRDAKTLVIEPDDVRAIIATSYDGDLVRFTCGDAGGGGGKVVASDDGSYVVTSGNEPVKRYWIAINGSSCALSQMPWTDPVTIPRAEQMFGFLTLDEARRAQQICLNLPIKKVNDFFNKLRPDVQSGRTLYRRPTNPDPPTQGQTAWMEGDNNEMSGAVRQAYDRYTEAAESGDVGVVILPGLPGGPKLH